jgi:phosphatidylinositol alpha-1,6-mannosyltransferase
MRGRPLKILYLTPGCFDKGGISRYTRYQITALREIVGPSNVCAFSLLGPTPSGFERPFQVDWYGASVSRLAKAEFVARVLAHAIVQRPDVILTAHVNMSGAAAAIGRSIGARTILNCYGLEIWSGLRRDSSFGLRRTFHVISDCHFTADYLVEQGLRERASVSVIWDCVDLSRFSPASPRPEVLARYHIPDPSTGFNILTLGRLTRSAAHKGYERLVDVFARVSRAAPLARLIFAGQGELCGELKARAQALGLGSRVHFTGGIHEDDLADVYRSAHVFSLVSDRGVRRGEGIPLTPLESAASGVPILVGNQDGSQEAVEQGENGYVLDSFDLDEHASKITFLASHPEIRAQMGQSARVLCERKFSYPRFVEEHRHLLESRFASAPISAHSRSGGGAAHQERSSDSRKARLSLNETRPVST